MSIGKSGGSSTTIPTLSPEQNAQIAAQTGFFTGTVEPTYQQAVTGATNLYNAEQPGVTTAAQNLAGTAAQAQNVLGTTGQSALNTGVTGLENLFSPDYQQSQINAALAPVQYQYQQNLANQGAQFGGAGELGSARQALAGQQLASTNAMNQASIAANIESNIAGQRLTAGQALAGIGANSLNSAINAANTQIFGSEVPMSIFNRDYLSQITNAPGYTQPNWSGTQGSSNTSTGINFGNLLSGSGL